MNLSKDEFLLLSQFIHQASGILVTEDKSYLIRQRLVPLLKSEHMSSFYELYQKLQRPDQLVLRDRVLMAMTTHETSFFRDGHPFDAFQQVLLPKLQNKVRGRKAHTPMRRGPKVDIWCAACSTGQEPYTLAMLIHEFVERTAYSGLALEDFRILATDLSTQVLVQAMEGRYNQVEVMRGLTAQRRDRYLSREGEHWFVNETLRSMVTFQRINLKDRFTSLGGFDVIFCRNVLIYFDESTQQRVFQQFREMLVDDGVVILGSSENLLIDKQIFRSERVDDTFFHYPRS